MTSATTTYTGVPTQTISYGYYPDGSHQSMTTPAGTFQYTDDAAGRAASLTNPFGETSSWAFLDNNWLSGQNSGGVLTAAYTHNARGLITDLTNRKADSTLLSEFGSIGYDAVGNMLSVTASVPTMTSYGGTSSYGYDSKNELTAEQGPGSGGNTYSYGYDGAGNPTTFKGQANAFNSANQNTANTYDVAGNPTTYKGTTLTFDAENRMTSFGGTTLTNGYRGDSLRAWKQNGNGRTYFLYSGSQLVCELSSSGTITATNTFGAAGLLSRHTSAGGVFYAFDSHSSVVQRLDGNGNVLSTQTFDAYGSRQSTDGNVDPYAGYGGQNGYYTDWETGTATAALALLTFRYYDPAAGRFLTRDPSGYKGGANLYEYVGNTPTSSSDPSGLGPIGNFGGAGGGCLGAMQGNSSGSDNDPCNDEYNACLAQEDCLVDMASAVLGWALVTIAVAATEGALAPLARILLGCFEGLISAIGHNLAENYCSNKWHHCVADASDACSWVSDVIDVVAGCIDGWFGGLLEEKEIKGLSEQAADYVFEYISASFSNRLESSSCFQR